jgi:outer membrane protein OmpA-like peptidoglycan-associated protein
MRILVVGFLLFALWSALSTYLWVNKIKDFSPKPLATQVDTLAVSPAPPKAVLPEKLVVYFDSDKSDFKAETITETLFTEFKSWLEQNPDSRISITGHTDASGSNKYNLELGNKRSQSARDFFINKGISPEKIITASRGEEEPVADNKTPEGKIKNRRSEIIIK